VLDPVQRDDVPAAINLDRLNARSLGERRSHGRTRSLTRRSLNGRRIEVDGAAYAGF
jgi:hypothetical protein